MKNFRRILFALLSVFVLATAVFSLASCSKCQHEYDNACDEKCNKCEEVRVISHDYKDATCTEPKTCKVCGKTTGEPDEDAHNYGGEYGISGGAHWLYCQNEGCEERIISEHVSEAPATYDSAEICKDCGYEIAPKLHMLTNKKVIFIGNSHTFYGHAVNEKTADNGSMSARQNDKGVFYKIANANGAVGLNVTNWTYGNHGLQDLFASAMGGEIAENGCQANRDCGNGYDHFKDLTDKYYDYVVIQQGSTHHATLFTQLETVMSVFREANPNVKFFFIVQGRAHNDNYAWLTDVKRIESELGMTIIDWGDLVYDIYTGAVAVPGAKYIHNKDAYVVARTEADGYHPSLLSGYITSLMTYCAITGESAVGKGYNVFSDETVSNFISLKYKIRPTNFDLILKSSEDMTGIQQLIDQYLEAKYYRTYTAENH